MVRLKIVTTRVVEQEGEGWKGAGGGGWSWWVEREGV